MSPKLILKKEAGNELGEEICDVCVVKVVSVGRTSERTLSDLAYAL